MVALLLVSIVLVNPSDTLKADAVEVGDGEMDDDFGGERTVVLSDEVMPMEDSKVAFSIGGDAVDAVIETGVEEVAYRSHTVSISLNGVEGYYLEISGNPNLTTASGDTAIVGITNANVVGGSILAGQWGYGWDYTNSKANESMVYEAVSSAGSRLTVPDLSDGAVEFTGKLNFAVNFPKHAVLGNYTSDVRLTLVVTPKIAVNYWRDAAGKTTTYVAGTEMMQGISEVKHNTDGGFCKGNNKVGSGWTVDLTDNRDDKVYTVIKMGDGNCWMAENLGLTGPLELTNADSDISANSWSMPKSTEAWSKDAYAIQIRTGNADLSKWKQGYGNYYSWSAATAGTNSESSSICPKGWKMPAYSDDGSFVKLIDAYKSGWLTGQFINGVADMSGFRFGYDNSNTASPYYWTNFWPAAGAINGEGAALTSAGGAGYYWTRRSADYNSAFHLTFFNNATFPQDNNTKAGNSYRYYGYSVRCVAEY